MNNISKKVTSIATAAAAVLCLGVMPIAGTSQALIPGFGITASAVTGVGYINSTGDLKTCSAYDVIKSSTTKLTGGWYVVESNVKLNSRLSVTGDANIILMDGCTLTASKGISVSSECKFNVYTQEGGSGRLFAGTTNGSNSTADSNRCGLGGDEAVINIIGGQVYAVGGTGAPGIMGSTIRLYWTNPEDLVYANSYSSAPRLNSVFVDKKNGKAFNTGTASAASVKAVTLSAATAIDSDMNYLSDGTYAVFGNLTNRNRIIADDQVDLYLASNAVFKVQEGITVESGSQLTINGTGKLYAGTTNGSTYSASNNFSGIGSENSNRAGDVVINGGIVYAAAGRNASAIGGRNAYVEINGGNVYAYGGSNGTGIGGSGANIRLGWTNNSDSIYSTSYSGTVNFAKNLYLDSNGDTARTGNIAGQTLVTTSKITNCTVSFQSNGGSYVSPITVTYNGYMNNLPTPTRSGYLFDGWYYDQYFNRAFNYNTRITQSMTLYAKWVRNDYCTVTYNANGGRMIGGAASESVDIRYNDKAYEPGDPTRNGYIFAGWYTEKGCYNLYNFNTRVTSNTTLYAGWIASAPDYYTVTFNANGGRFANGNGDDMEQVPAGANALSYGPAFPTRDGYEFTGWYLDRNARNLYGGDGVYSTMTLYAGWDKTAPANYTVTFNANGGQFANGNGDDMEEVPSGANALSYGPAFPTRSGYEFTGWYLDRNARTIYGGEGVNRSMTLYAGWEKTSPAYCTVSYQTNGGSYVSARNVNYGDPIGASELSYRDGYEFTGWYTDSSCRNLVNLNTPVYSDITLYAGWKEIAPAVKTYTLTFYLDDQYLDTQTVQEGGYASPSFYGSYSFTNSIDGGPFSFNSPVYRSMDLYAYSNAAAPDSGNNDWWFAGSTFGGAGLIAAIAGGVVVIGGGVAAGIAVSKKKKNAKKDDENNENK